MNYNLDKKYKNDREKFLKNKKIMETKKGNQQIYEKVTYLNIDSRNRRKHPVNIIKSEQSLLSSNPITLTINSSEIKINIVNHKYAVGDKIIIQNVEGSSKILNSTVYFYDAFDYAIIYFPSHGINSNYLNYQSNFEVKIELNEDIVTSDRLIDNMPLNSILGPQDAILTSTSSISVPSGLTTDLSISSSDLESDYFFIKLPFNFKAASGSLVTVSKIFKINFLNIGNIPLKYVNANFPVNYKQYQGHHLITKVETNYIYFNSKIKSYLSSTCGGSLINVSKVIKTLPGYPSPNCYTIPLKNSFNNVTSVELVSTEIPYVDFVIKSSGINANNKLYWKNLEDGDTIYNISIPEGNYTETKLISVAQNLMNSTERVQSTTKKPLYNIFEISLNYISQEVKFKSFREDYLPDSITVALVTIDSESYYQLTIVQEYNFVEVGDTITISGSNQIGVVEGSYINTSHTVYSIDKSNNSYTVLINYLNVSGSSVSGNGGNDIKIKTKTKSSFLFNYNFTAGKLFGFKDTGEDHAITVYSHEITRNTSYIYTNNLNEVGDSEITNNIFNLQSEYRYLLLVINNFETIVTNKKIPNSFAKIRYYGDIGDVLYNNFTCNPYIDPIKTLNELKVDFYNPDGTKPDFRNLDNSFTLRIVEKIPLHVSTGSYSEFTSYDTEIEKIVNLTNDEKNLDI